MGGGVIVWEKPGAPSTFSVLSVHFAALSHAGSPDLPGQHGSIDFGYYLYLGPLGLNLEFHFELGSLLVASGAHAMLGTEPRTSG